MNESKTLAAGLATINAKVRDQLAAADTPKVKIELLRVSVEASKGALNAAQAAAAKSLQRGMQQ